MNLDDFQYNLPQELIAQTPAEPRDSSRLMILNKSDGTVRHMIFSNLPNLLAEGDLLVMNNSKVIPARIIGHKRETGGKVECLLLRPISKDSWEALVRPGRRLARGTKILFRDGELEGEILRCLPFGSREIYFHYRGDFRELLLRFGLPPLPPYIKTDYISSQLSSRYQTVYAKENGIYNLDGIPWGSVAAPTAGLHFTHELMEELTKKGVRCTYVTLHVGWGTFRPVSSQDITKHEMHEEWFMLPQETADAINSTKARGGRVVAVGTTACRVLEQCAGNGILHPSSGWTKLFITPGYKFKCVDRLITNFHLPGTTLLMLVAAFAGLDQVITAYGKAVRDKYRFFSFGDAILIL